MTKPSRGPLPAASAAALALAVSACHAAHSFLDPGIEPAVALEPATMASAPTDLDPDRLSGLDGVELTTLLGAADFDRRDGPAQILQYRNGTCTLDVFLYRDAPDEAFRVAHVEARDHEMREVPRESCLRSLRETRRNAAGRS